MSGGKDTGIHHCKECIMDERWETHGTRTASDEGQFISDLKTRILRPD